MKTKKILIGITAGIAAYKIATLTRLFIKQDAEVRILMTPFAKKFITPLTLSTLSKNVIFTEFYNPENGEWNSHVDLGLWADVFIIAPATANTIAKMANGIADNLLLTTYLSAKCPVFFAPAMDLDMYKHPATQKNIQTLIERGNTCIEASSGELASGLHGKGRMQEPEIIADEIKHFFEQKKDFTGKNILITAGPTQETIDPVRFISNHSTGKMGYAIAHELAERGAKITLISGQVNISTENENINLIKILSAKEMYDEAKKYYKNSDIAIFAAAVADYTPINPKKTKTKKNAEKLIIELEKTKDIAFELGKLKTNKQINIGFALETDNELHNAKQKIKKKNFDFIVLNSLKDKGAGFKHDTNKITIIDKNNQITNFELKTKKEVARDIVDSLI